jgi:hypothetical protein
VTILAEIEIAAGAAAAAGLVTLGPAVIACLPAVPCALVPEHLRDWWRSGYERRPTVPARLKRRVFAADRRRCAYCGSRAKLVIDHIRPWSCSGVHALWNLMLLCSVCNTAKSNFWIRPDGSVYSPFTDLLAAQHAEMILRFQRRHRWNPGRWIRAGWAR